MLYIAVPLLGILFFLSLAGVAYYASLPATEVSEHQDRAHPNDQEPEKQKPSYRGFVRFLFPDAPAIFTFFLVLATIALCYVAYLQIGLLRRAEIISDNTARAAKDSAEAAKRSIEATVSLERPYLFLGDLRIMQVFDDRLPRIEGVFKNGGKTPAFILECVYAFNIQEAKNLGDPAAILRQQPRRCTNLGETVAPDKSGEKLFFFDGPPRPDEMTQIRNGTKSVILFGEVSYEDVFGNVHTEGFGYSFRPPTLEQFERERDRQTGETDRPIRYFFRIGVGYPGDPYGYRRTEPKNQWRGFFERMRDSK